MHRYLAADRHHICKPKSILRIHVMDQPSHNTDRLIYSAQAPLKQSKNSLFSKGMT